MKPIESIKVSRITLSRIAEVIPEFYVLKIDRVANELKRAGKDVIKLNLGKSEVPMPDYVTNEFIEKMKHQELREVIDSQGLPELRSAIAADYSSAHAAKISADRIFINNGTSPFFLTFFLLLADPGDSALFPRPYYPTYVANARIAQLRPQYYNIVNGRIDLEEFKKIYEAVKPKIVFLNSPGNPFGNVLSKFELSEILRIVDGRSFVISDEIYDGFVYEDNFSSILTVADSERDSVILINGFSKIHHMYTRRLGYAIVPEHLIEPLLRFQQHNVVCVDPVTQYAGLAAMKQKSEHHIGAIKKEVAEYRGRLEKSRALIEGSNLHVIRPEGSFYMCIDVSKYLDQNTPDSMTLAELLLREAGVAVTPGEDFGRPDFFRISLTSSQVVEGVRRLVAYLGK